MSDLMPTTRPIVFIEGDGVFASSLGIGERFGKQHFHVLRDIDDWIAKLAKVESDASRPGCIDWSAYFVPADYIDDSGRSHRAFNLNRAGAMLLIFGYKGDEAAKLQLAYVAAFDAMETLLRAGPKHQSKAKPVNTEPKPTRITGALINAAEKALAHKLALLPNLSPASQQLMCKQYAALYGVTIDAPVIAGKWYTGTDVVRMINCDINSLKHDPRYKRLRKNANYGENRLVKVNDGRDEKYHWHWNEAGKDAVLAAFRPTGSVVPFTGAEDDEDVA